MKKTIQLFIVFLFCTIYTISNDEVISLDSLQYALGEKQEDTSKVEVLLLLSNENKKLNNDNEVVSFALEALILSKRLNYSHGEVSALINLGDIYSSQGNYVEAEDYLNQALLITENTNNSDDLINIHIQLGKLYRAKGDFNKSMGYILSNIKLQEKNHNSKGIINSLIELGAINREQGYFLRANESFSKAYTIASEIKDIDLQLFAKIEHGRTLREQGDIEEALIVLKDAQKQVNENNIEWLAGYALDEIGKVYTSKKNYAAALEQYMKSSKIAEKNNSDNSLGYTYLNISTIYRLYNNQNKAREYCEKSLAIRRKIQDNKGIVRSLNELGEIYLIEGNLDKALELKTEALAIASETGAKSLMLESYQGLSKVYSMLKRYEEALNYHQLYSSIKDSVSGGNNARKVAEMQNKYEEEKTDKEISLLKKEQELKDIESQRQQYMLIAVGFVLLLVAALAYVMFKQFKEKKKANALLESTNLELEKLSIVASETDNAILITDAEGNFEWTNNAFIKLSGYTLEEFKEIYGHSLFKASSTESISSAVNRCVTERISVTYEYRSTHKSGTEYWATATLTPILNDAGEIRKMVVIESDITDKKHAQIKIQEKNKKISDSINYAKKIQDSIIPSIESIRSIFSDSFIFYHPKDVVSGDFPWFFKKGDDIYIAAVDCTGHGVPGAMISFVGYFLLNEINNHPEILSPSVILDQLHEKLVYTLKQDSPNSANARDGMDIALCKINFKNSEVQFSGAHRPLIIYKNKQSEIEIIKGDKLAIGGKIHKILANKKSKEGFENEEITFTNFQFNFEKGDAIYFSSDGLQDQFGGPEKLKYGMNRMKDLIMDNAALPMEEMNHFIKKDYLSWKGKEKQIDDVLLVGIRF